MIIFCLLYVVIIFSDNVYGRGAKYYSRKGAEYYQGRDDEHYQGRGDAYDTGRGAEYYPGRCEKQNTRYILPERCDTYMECNHGEPTRMICRYGQYFHNITDVSRYPCEYLDGKYCGDRQYYKEYVYDDSLCNQQFTQPQFRVGDATTCNEYVECSEGQLFNKECDADTAFHPVDHICVWPGDSPDCDAPSFCAHIGKHYNSETKMCNSDYQ